jgi:WD40 repeat protein
LISGDEQGNIILWTTEGETDGYESRFDYLKQWGTKAHKGSISSLGVFASEQDPSTGLIFSGGNDGKVKVYSWKGQGNQVKVEEVQELGLGGRMPLDLVVTTLPSSNGKSAPSYRARRDAC